jgi:putative nucleotidyltransferase with HDIG domain
MKTTLNILIVEDETFLAQHLEATVQEFNDGQVFIATDAQQAIDIALNNEVDFILMDIVLPGHIDGIEAAKEIQKVKNIPIVYLTAHQNGDFLERLSKTEPFGYILKPVQPLELKAVLSIATQKHKTQLLLERESNILSTLQKIFHPLIITDERLSVTSINEAAQKLFPDYKSLDISSIFYKNGHILNIEQIIHFAKSNNGLFKDEDSITVALANGSTLPVSLTLSLVYDSLNTLKNICFMFVDLTGQIIEKNELHSKQLEAAELLIQERLLKDVLNIGKDINKTLLYEDSLKTKLLKSVNRIVQFANFNIANISLYENNILSNFVTSNNGHLYLSHKDKIPKDDEFSKRIYRCVENGEVDLWTESDAISPSFFNSRAAHLPVKSTLLLPLHNVNENHTHGILIISSSHEYAFSIDIVNYFEEFANTIALALSLHKHRDEIDKLKTEKLDNYEQTILSFVQVVEERDAYTKGHSQRVAEYAKMLAKAMDFSDKDISTLYKAGILHDIGKIQTPDKILMKPGMLTSTERNIIEEHVMAGVRMISHIAMYKDIADIIKHHHERYDGTGYPHKLKGDEVSLSASILQVADVFDAMTTNRIYRKSLSKEEAINELKNAAGTQLHPLVVEVALKVFKNITLPNTTRVFDSILEQERMAYFFHDSLTHLYNEEYMNMLQYQLDFSKKYYMYVIRLSGLANYNESKGWCEGNKRIKELADVLLNNYAGKNTTAFRIHGNKFTLISQQKYDTKSLQNTIENTLNHDALKITVMNITLNNAIQENQNKAIDFEKIFHDLNL